MAARIEIHTTDNKPESGTRRVRIMNHSDGKLIDTVDATFANGAALVDTFEDIEGVNAVVYAPESSIFGDSETAVVVEATLGEWVGGPTELVNVLAYGQSLSRGETFDPDNITLLHDQPLNGGFLLGIPAEGTGGEDSDYTEAQRKPVKFKHTNWETPGWGFINLFRSLEVESNINNGVIWSASGRGGQTVAYLADETKETLQNFKRLVQASSVAGNWYSLSYSVPFWLWDQGESDTNTDPTTYKASLRSLHDYVTGIAQGERAAGNTDPYPVILSGIGSADRPIVNTSLYEYTLENPDAYYSVSKYFINHHYPASPTSDKTHLSPEGYTIQGEYHAIMANRYMSALRAGDASPELRVLEPLGYSTSGNVITINMNVPVPPMVIDTVKLPEVSGYGIKYVRLSDGVEVTPSVSVSGNSLIVDLGEAPTEGSSLVFGTTSNGQALTNIRDSQAIESDVSGVLLHNWLPLHTHVLLASEV